MTSHDPSRDHTGDRSVADVDVLEAFARALLNHERHDEHDELERTLGLVVAHAVDSLPAVQGAGVSLVTRDGSVTSYASSDDNVAALDALQGTLSEGPCYDCIREQSPAIVNDMAVAGVDRWPRFAPVALEHRVAAMCSVRLVARHHSAAGTLNLYATQPGAFDASCLATASLMASHAALAVHAAQRMADFAEALESRDVIARAKGILIERFGLNDEEAFERLRNSSQTTNVKLRDVAAWLVADTIGEADNIPTPRPRPNHHEAHQP
ncbi:GAF domain-containing protein [Actinomycetospora succinea]|uniref:GAF domain-containing protein n=1 Tax=Actinomycetospora succinea TaxID=663603 RepID=A0A4R6UMI2_9PSEU|nr:GAF and ANTAR domain-containing protein [Actinomycetospora succinea]TDQ46375.1 GAF domain-containing protein [Actinomycetospora succinea]